MTTLLVDGNNLLARADFAAKGKHVEMSVGEVNTAALVIYINMMSRYVRQVQPDRVRVLWDGGHDFRDEIYPAYKAARKKRPEGDPDDTQPFAQARDFLVWAGVPQLQFLGWEADDLIALSDRATPGKTVILSGDKDLLQLVHDDKVGEGKYQTTQIRVPDDTEWTEARVEEKFGVLPHHLPYYLALVGDPGDGVPGVKGVGPKKALKALQEADWDWEALLAGNDPETAKEARLMRSLVDLRYTEYPEWLRIVVGAVDAFSPTTEGTERWKSLMAFCDRYELRSIRERLEQGTLWHDQPTPSTEGLFDNFDLDVETTRRGEILDPPGGRV